MVYRGHQVQCVGGDDDKIVRGSNCKRQKRSPSVETSPSDSPKVGKFHTVAPYGKWLISCLSKRSRRDPSSYE